MKRKIRIVLVVLFLLKTGAWAQFEVFDPTNWLEAINMCYQMYDQVTKSITMIEQNYEQMRFYIDRARSFYFEEIEWDGDLDFRNEIFNATSQIDKQLSNIRGVRDSFRKENIMIGGKSFSIEDLCGFGDSDKTIKDFVKDTWNEVKTTVEKAAEQFEEELSEEEAAMLWEKFGLTPANYYMVHNVKQAASKAVETAMSGISDQVYVDENRDFYQAVSNIMDMVKAANAHPGGATEAELEQIEALLLQQTIYGIKDLERALQQGISYQSWAAALQKQEEESKAASQKQKDEEMAKKFMDPDF